MDVPKDAQKRINKDILKWLLQIRKKNLSFDVYDISTTSEDAYDFYSQHNRVIREEVEFYKEVLKKEDQEMEALFPDAERRPEKKWVYYDEGKPGANELKYKFYLNPKLEFFNVAHELMQVYYALPKPQGVYQLKFLDYRYVEPEFLQRIERVVFWVSKKSTATAIAAALKKIPRKYFNAEIPRFTHKIANGRSWMFNPKQNNAVDLAARSIYQNNDIAFSYGFFIAHALALGVKAVFVTKYNMKKGKVHFGDYSKREIKRVIWPRVCETVHYYMKDGLHI